MAASVSINLGSLNGGGMHNGPGGGSGIAFEIEISECVATSSPIPKRVRQRLEETTDGKSPASLEEIEFKLKEADSRRQQFHEWLANKARAKPRTSASSSHSEQAENLAQKLEAKLSAAEHKRAELLAHEQTRLAKLHELRVAAKTEAQLRAEREREELGSKVESRVQQAEINRLALVEAERQRIAAVHERVAQSILQRTTQEGRDRERIEALRVTICQKIAAAEEKRAGLLEAEKNRAQACVLQARRVAKAVVHERELETRKKKERLEARLQRAKRQRAEYLMKRGGCRGSCHNHGHKLHHKHAERLCRKLTRCWRQFRGSRCTTYALTKEYAACAINQELVVSLPFEQLASRITSPATLRAVKPLLARLESRLMLSCAEKSNVGKIEHLLRRLSAQRRKPGGGGSNSNKAGAFSSGVSGKSRTSSSSTANRGLPKETAVVGLRSPYPSSQFSPSGTSRVSSKDNGKVDDKELERYPARVFLCAYMILGQPDAVFSSRGGREIALAEAAAKLLPEFEALLSIILDGPSSTVLPPLPPSNDDDDGGENHDGAEEEKRGMGAGRRIASTAAESQENQERHHQHQVHHFTTLPSAQRPFSAQLLAFDAAWCTYLYNFVAWKVKDAQLLEDDLTRMACQLELSMLQKCKAGSDLSHDSQAIRKQVLEDQKLLHDRILPITGAAGAARMEQALAEVRSKFNEALENGSPLPSPFSSPSVTSRTPITSPASPSPFLESPKAAVTPNEFPDGAGNKLSVVRSLFNSPNKDSAPPQETNGIRLKLPPSQQVLTPPPPSAAQSERPQSTFSNEKIIIDMLHDQNWQLSDPSQVVFGTQSTGPASTQLSELQARIRSTIETAFWDGIVEGLMEAPPQYERVVMLVAEVRKELENIVPEKWKQDLQDSMDLELLREVLESGSHDFEYLRHLLDYASGLILKLGAPVRDSRTKAAHQSLLAGLSVAAACSNVESQRNFADALVKGMRFIFHQLQVLKQDINSTRLKALAPLINGSAGVDYARKAFATRLNLSLPGLTAADSMSIVELSSKLPRTTAWIADVICSLEQDRAEVEAAMAIVKRGPSAAAVGDSMHGDGLTGFPAPLPTPSIIPSMRTGGRVGVGVGGFPSATSSAIPSSGGAEALKSRQVVWKSNDTIVRMAVLALVARLEPATEANVPETLSLNVDRLRICQNEFQRIVVMATGLLVARQGLSGKGVLGTELDSVMQAGCEQLDALLSEPTATIAQIGALLAKISSKTTSSSTNAPVIEDIAAYGELMTRVLTKSLSPEDAVFARVSAAVAASLRAVLLLGKGPEGLAVANLALKRIGGSMLIDKVTSTSDMVEKIFSVTSSVHEPWYSCITANMP